MPRAVTPWFTAFKAYSAMYQSSLSSEILKQREQSKHTNLDQLSTVKFVSPKLNLVEYRKANLGEKVVNENE